MKVPERILLAHGAGGRLTGRLVRETFLAAFDNPALAPLADAAILGDVPPGRIALATDGHVVDPPVFPGGDLGYLAVAGTVNDLAVSGARPLALTFAVILEEGCPGDLLATCVEGARRAAGEAGVSIVAGDTKVVPRGRGDGIYAVTAGLGVVPRGRELGDALVREGDEVLVTGPLGDHGATILGLRHGLRGEELRSDVAPLADLVEHLLDRIRGVRALHDPTRGGLVSVCHEVLGRAPGGLAIALREENVPVRPAVRAACELLGLDPLWLACEGRAVVFCAPEAAGEALAALRAHPRGREAARVGRVVRRESGMPPVVLETATGSVRALDLLSGHDLPRIC